MCNVVVRQAGPQIRRESPSLTHAKTLISTIDTSLFGFALVKKNMHSSRDVFLLLKNILSTREIRFSDYYVFHVYEPYKLILSFAASGVSPTFTSQVYFYFYKYSLPHRCLPNLSARPPESSA